MLKYQRTKIILHKEQYIFLKRVGEGITVRSTIDLLIVETVPENELLLLHNDTDFVNISKVVVGLKFY